jgi:hypothetical protein
LYLYQSELSMISFKFVHFGKPFVKPAQSNRFVEVSSTQTMIFAAAAQRPLPLGKPHETRRIRSIVRANSHIGTMGRCSQRTASRTVAGVGTERR